MLVFDGLSVFLVSQMLFWPIKGGNNVGVDTFSILQRSILGICTRIPFLYF